MKISKVATSLSAAMLLMLCSPLYAAADETQTFRDCTNCPEMVALSDQGFAIGKYEITFDDWDACIADGGCSGYLPAEGKKAALWGRGKRPVIYISWDDAQSYLQWLSKKTGKPYRLPKGNEWEQACSGGSKTEYCGTGKIRDLAWFDENSDTQTHPVGEKQANAYGLYDMTGNVWEWTEDCVRDDCTQHVIRGGSWNYDSTMLRASIRINFASSMRSYSYGFRVLRPLP